MKLLAICYLVMLTFASPNWKYDLFDAKLSAQKEHKFILLNFSGSDWCAPCNSLHKEILESSEFVHFANRNLVMVNADFPKLKKNQLPPAQQKMNEAMAEKYNPKGIFPLTLLLDEQGEILKTWEGKPMEGAYGLIGDIRLAIIMR